MEQSAKGDKKHIVILVLVVLIGAPFSWWFFRLIEVDFSTSVAILVRVGWVTIAVVALLKMNVFTKLESIPVSFIGLCWSIYPALDYWLYGS